MERVRADIHVPGQGNESHEAEYCYLSHHSDGDDCPIGGGGCRFGLTEIKVPETCPLRLSPVVIRLSRLSASEVAAAVDAAEQPPEGET